MNWTGGEYTKAASGRHSATLQHQKAHFARARAAVHAQARAIQHRTTSEAQSPFHSSKRARIEPHRMTQDPPFRPKSLDGESRKDDQELRLLEKRQALLQRSDWIGLRATQPLRIKFESEAEKDMIGRRRKVVKKTPAARRRHREALSIDQPTRQPLGIARARQLPISSAAVAVGSDALGTQTQAFYSGRNQPQRGSSAMDDLSEEPMLLDSDDDLFEKEPSLQEYRHEPATDDQQNQELSSLRPSDAPDCQLEAASKRDRSHQMARFTSSTPLLEAFALYDEPSLDTEPAPQITSSERRRQYDRCWQKALGLPTTSEDDASHAAVASFVRTISTQQPRPLVQSIRRRFPSNARSTPMKSTAKDSLQVHLSETSAETKCSEGNSCSTSESLQVLQKLQAAPHQKPEPAKKKWSSSDAIWRQFIIGDSSGRSESPTE